RPPLARMRAGLVDDLRRRRLQVPERLPLAAGADDDPDDPDDHAHAERREPGDGAPGRLAQEPAGQPVDRRGTGNDDAGPAAHADLLADADDAGQAREQGVVHQPGIPATIRRERRFLTLSYDSGPPMS